MYYNDDSLLFNTSILQASPKTVFDMSKETTLE